MILRSNPPLNLRGATSSRVDQRLRKFTVEKIEEHEALRKAGDAVLVYGPEGSGKSGMLASIHNQLAEWGWLLTWLDCNLWPDNFEESWFLTQDLQYRGALIVDDLGREPQAMRKYVARILVARLAENQLTYITTNLNVNEEDREACELTDFYSAAIRSRLLGQCDVVYLDGEDRRL